MKKYKLTITKYEGKQSHKSIYNEWNEALKAFNVASQTMLMFYPEVMSLNHMDKRFLLCSDGAVKLEPKE